MIPANITEEHILQALKDIEENGIRVPLAKSTRYDLIFDGKFYPPKYTISLANQFANNEYLTHKAFNTYQAQDYLRSLSPNFIIKEKEAADPVKKLIEKYKAHIKINRLQDEIYKWRQFAHFQRRPNLNATDLFTEIKGINYGSLIYKIAIAVIYHLAKDKPEEYKQCLQYLFDDTTPLAERLKYYDETSYKLYRELVPEERLSHHQDERTMATLLTFYNPDEYALFKDSFYQKYCKLIKEPAKKKGEKYIHYLELLDNFIDEYILADNELQTLIKEFIPADAFQDVKYKLLAQDILYQTLDKRLGDSKSYWRIGTKDSEKSYWEEMKTEGKICIGWGEIGNLEDADIKNKKDIQNLLLSEGFYPNDNRTLSRKAGEIYTFYNDVNIGDVILAQDGDSVLGIGVVTGSYEYNEDSVFPHQKKMDWRVFPSGFFNDIGRQTTVYKIDNNADAIKKIDDLLNNSQSEQTNTGTVHNTIMKQELNQILYGPPGTGKTYNTINKALETIGEPIAGKSREEIKALFDDKVKEGQIVFTTFHQSMSYEDFIEGIKPIAPDNEGDPVIYKTEPGIFRRLCIEASFSLAQENDIEITDSIRDFSQLYDTLAESVEERILKGETVELPAKGGGTVIVDDISQQGNFIIKHHNGKRTYTVSKERLSRLQPAINDLDKVNNIHEEFRAIIGGCNSSAYWSVLNAIRNEQPIESVNKEKHNYSFEEKQEVVRSLIKADYKNKNGKPYVLIIDEINRGNVSQIFGELITLIEDDKRLGKDEALEATLPYSKEKFGVPPNLYIIGTMNTADRSVEALDAALRRRFCFEEMQPDADKIRTDGKAANGMIDDIDLPLLLTTINKRIEKLLDKDHQIGHSYFIQVDSLSSLQSAFQHKIIPLLQEYFFGDYGKIGLVLGQDFFEPVEQTDETLFATFGDYEASQFAERPIYKLKNIATMQADTFKTAINTLLKK